jgi:hypothetical protein
MASSFFLAALAEEELELEAPLLAEVDFLLRPNISSQCAVVALCPSHGEEEGVGI